MKKARCNVGLTDDVHRKTGGYNKKILGEAEPRDLPSREAKHISAIGESHICSLSLLVIDALEFAWRIRLRKIKTPPEHRFYYQSGIFAG